METAISYINTEVMVLIPVLYAIGLLIKIYAPIKNKYIPLILFILGIIAACLLMKEISIDTMIQGILVSSVSVFVNQLWKQLMTKDKDEIINETTDSDNKNE